MNTKLEKSPLFDEASDAFRDLTIKYATKIPVLELSFITISNAFANCMANGGTPEQTKECILEILEFMFETGKMCENDQ